MLTKVLSPKNQIGMVVILPFIIALFLLTNVKPGSWNDISRVAAIESLVERGTWAIDQSPWAGQTMDKVYANGKFYSDKMPVLTVMGAGIYWILHNTLGATLAPNCSESGRICAYYWVTLSLVGIPGTLLVWLFFKYGQKTNLPVTATLIGTAAFAFGTMVFPFSLILVHHVPAAACLFAGFYILVTRGLNDRGRLLAIGLLAALAMSFDPVSSFLAVPIFVLVFLRYRLQAIYCLIGASGPLVLTVLFDYQMAGTIVPPYMIAEGYNYPGSAFPPTIAGTTSPISYPYYAFQMFLSTRGLFAYNPILVLALFGAIASVFKAGHPLRLEAIITVAGFLLLCVYLALGTQDWGGKAYGERYFVPAIPMLFSFIFFAGPLDGKNVSKAPWVAFGLLLAISAFSTFQGAKAPWTTFPPPFYLTRVGDFPFLGLAWNIHL